MSTTRVRALLNRTRGAHGLAAAIAALGALALAPASANALAVSVTMPSPVTVGQAGLTAKVLVTNTSQTAARVCNVGECDGSEGIIFIPSCAELTLPTTCKTPDLGVFTVAPVATIPLGAQCGLGLVTSFNVVVADAAQGKLRLEPNVALTLGPAGTATAACDIPLTFGVAKLPATDAAPDAGAQTRQLASARVQNAAGGPEQASGESVTTVIPAPTVPPPNPPPVPPVPPPVPPPPPVQPSDLDHFKCYEALQPNFRQRTVGTRDQFGQRRARVLRTRQLCNPVSQERRAGPAAARASRLLRDARHR